MANFTVATNFDAGLLTAIRELNQQHSSKIVEVYGSLPYSIIGSARAGAGLPDVSSDDFAQHIKLAHNLGLKFNYLLNANAGIKLNSASYAKSIHIEIECLLRAGVDSLTIADAGLMDLVRKEYPATEVHLSIVRGINTIEEAKMYANKGILTITLNQHTLNRDFQRIKEIVKSVPEVELRLYANVSCLNHCHNRNAHYKYLSKKSQFGNVPLAALLDPYIINCALTYLRNPKEFLKSPFIRPEDIAAYESMGIRTFKLSDRREPTAALVELLKAYISGEFHGNLFDLLFRNGRKWTNSFTTTGVMHPLLPDIFIDNDELTKIKFLDRVKALKREELDEFYRMATEQAIRGVDSLQTKVFETWISRFRGVD